MGCPDSSLRCHAPTQPVRDAVNPSSPSQGPHLGNGSQRGRLCPLKGIREIREGGFGPLQLLGVTAVTQWVEARKAMPGRIPPKETCCASNIPPDIHVGERPVYPILQLNSGLHIF